VDAPREHQLGRRDDGDERRHRGGLSVVLRLSARMRGSRRELGQHAAPVLGPRVQRRPGQQEPRPARRATLRARHSLCRHHYDNLDHYNYNYDYTDHYYVYQQCQAVDNDR